MGWHSSRVRACGSARGAGCDLRENTNLNIYNVRPDAGSAVLKPSRTRNRPVLFVWLASLDELFLFLLLHFPFPFLSFLENGQD